MRNGNIYGSDTSTWTKWKRYMLIKDEWADVGFFGQRMFYVLEKYTLLSRLCLLSNIISLWVCEKLIPN